MKYVYLITVDHHYDSPDYYLCATEAAADKLFKKIVKENYFDPKEDTEEDFKKACYSWYYWDGWNGDIVRVSTRQLLTEDEI